MTHRVLITMIVCLAMLSCKKTNQDATVTKDCTGTYLTIDSKDFKVCNEDILEAYEDGTIITASFKKLKECKPLENKVTCELYHEYKYWIEITKIKSTLDS